MGFNLLLLFVLLQLGVFPKSGPTFIRPLIVDLIPDSTRSASAPKQTETAEIKQAATRPVPKPPPIILPVKPTITPPDRPLPIIPLTKEEMAAADVRNLPRAGSGAGSGDRGDSEAVGRGPNGEVLYAAQWAREPTDAELGFYLPKDAPDGYGLIACKTYPQNRVDDCVALESYPETSHLARAVLNAAWQFKVRAPRKNGQPMIGEWVEIRIEYLHSGKGE